jgi:hypothetical protein
MNSLLLHMLLPSLQQHFAGRRISGVCWYPPILAVDFAPPESSSLVAILSDPGPFCFRSDPEQVCRDGAAPVFEEVYGSTLRAIGIPRQDRTLSLSLTGEDREWTLSLLLFGEAGCALVHRGGQVIRSVGGKPTLFTSSRERLPGALTLVSLRRDALEPPFEPGRPPTETIPDLSPHLAKCFISADGRFDLDGILEFRDRLLRGETDFYLYYAERPGRASPLPARPPRLESGETVLGPFGEAGDACRELGRILISAAHRKILDKLAGPLQKRLDSRRDLQEHLLGELETAAEHPCLRRETEALAAYQTRIPAGADSVTLPDPYDPDNTLTIALDPSIPISAQIRRRFRNAAKLERSEAKIRRRRSQVEAEIAALEDVLGRYKTLAGFGEARVLLESAIIKMKLSRPAASNRPARSSRTYRRFEVHPTWFVLVGRNNKENDELTFHVAGPDDLWFHAQNVAGSHVVLKHRGGRETYPPRRILELTAAIAAFYSKSRHSGLVPVIYTRRKFVRKPRKAPPGRVICEREKTIFVEPALPPAIDMVGDK